MTVDVILIFKKQKCFILFSVTDPKLKHYPAIYISIDIQYIYMLFIYNQI